MLLRARRLILRIRVRGVHAQPPKGLCQVLRRGRGQRRREGREWASRRGELGSDEMGVGRVDHVQRFQYGDRRESLVEQMRSERLSWLAGHDADLGAARPRRRIESWLRRYSDSERVLSRPSSVGMIDGWVLGQRRWKLEPTRSDVPTTQNSWTLAHRLE
jgi:hypothetical protein